MYWYLYIILVLGNCGGLMRSHCIFHVHFDFYGVEHLWFPPYFMLFLYLYFPDMSPANAVL